MGLFWESRGDPSRVSRGLLGVESAKNYQGSLLGFPKDQVGVQWAGSFSIAIVKFHKNYQEME